MDSGGGSTWGLAELFINHSCGNGDSRGCLLSLAFTGWRLWTRAVRVSFLKSPSTDEQAEDQDVGVPRMIWEMLEIRTLGQPLSSREERKVGQRNSCRNSAVSRTEGERVPCAAKSTDHV